MRFLGFLLTLSTALAVPVAVIPISQSNTTVLTFDQNVRRGYDLFMKDHEGAQLISVNGRGKMGAWEAQSTLEGLVHIQIEFWYSYQRWLISTDRDSWGDWAAPKGFLGARVPKVSFRISDLNMTTANALTRARQANYTNNINRVFIGSRAYEQGNKTSIVYNMLLAPYTVTIDASTGVLDAVHEDYGPNDEWVAAPYAAPGDYIRTTGTAAGSIAVSR